MNGKIYAIMSLVPQNGAKYVTTNLGYFANKLNKKNKVLLIDLDFNNPVLCYHYVKDSVYNIDNLVPLKNDLNEDFLLDNITKTNLGFDILKGTNIKNKNYITAEIVAKILTLVKKIYTHIFIVIPSDLAISSVAITLLNSNKLILVLRSNYANDIKVISFLENMKSFLKDGMTINIIINNKDYNHSLNISDKISKTDNINVNYLGILDYDTRTVDNINLGEKSIFRKSNSNNRIFKDICKKML